MDIDDLDDILLDDYETFDTNTNQQRTATFDPLDPTLPSADGSNAAGPPITKRRQYKKLDAELLLSSKGLPRIRKQAPLIKFYGKGNEDADLRKLMDYYQMWAHNLYPRLQFRDFARNVMKATANPRVREELRTWQDEHREKMDERARMLAEIEGEEDPLADTSNSQHSDNEDGDDEEAMNEVFMDYLVGVKRGTISVEDAPTPATAPSRSIPNPPAPPNDSRNDDTDNDDDDDLFMNFINGVNRSPPTTDDTTPTTTATAIGHASSSNSSSKPAQAPAQNVSTHDSTDDEDGPLFLHVPPKKRRRFQVGDDEDMSE